MFRMSNRLCLVTLCLLGLSAAASAQSSLTAKVGNAPATAPVVETILASRPHPQQGFRACLGIMRLGKRYGDGRLEAACHRAIRIGACSYKSIESILKHDLDRQPLPSPPAAATVITHSNIRGAQYYHSNQGERQC